MDNQAELFGRLVKVAGQIALGRDFISPVAEDHSGRTPRSIIAAAQKQQSIMKDWAYEIRQVADSLHTRADIASTEVAPPADAPSADGLCTICGSPLKHVNHGYSDGNYNRSGILHIYRPAPSADTLPCRDCGERDFHDAVCDYNANDGKSRWPVTNDQRATTAPSADKERALEIVSEWRAGNDWPGLVWSSRNLSDEPRWLAAWADLESRIAAALAHVAAEREKGCPHGNCTECFQERVERDT